MSAPCARHVAVSTASSRARREEQVCLAWRRQYRPAFDLETNLRVAEFKFINWRGGTETIRQNGVFKDYLLLALHPTAKRKHLYLLGTDHAVKFLRGGRALSSVLNRLGWMLFKATRCCDPHRSAAPEGSTGS